MSISFVGFNGKNIYLFAVQNYTEPDVGQYDIYLSSNASFDERAKKIIENIDGKSTLDTVYVSQNSGTKNMVFVNIAGDGADFKLFDENGNPGNTINLSKMGLGTTIAGMYGLQFGQWKTGTNQFTIIANSSNEHSYEALFDGTTGEQIGETKVIK